LRYIIVILLLLGSTLQGAIVEITSDKFYGNDNASKVFFMDKVEVKKVQDRLFCHLLAVYFNEKQEALKYDASGGVRFDIFR